MSGTRNIDSTVCERILQAPFLQACLKHENIYSSIALQSVYERNWFGYAQFFALGPAPDETEQLARVVLRLNLRYLTIIVSSSWTRVVDPFGVDMESGEAIPR